MNQYLTFLTDAEEPDTEPPETSTPEDTTPESTMRAWVNTVSGSLNLRKKAKQGADLIRTIPQYAEVAVLDKGSTWCKVTYQGSTGYVMTQFLSFNKVNNEIEEETTPGTAVYAWVDTENGKSLNLRNKPNGDRIGSIPNGERVTVLEKGSTWYKIVYGGQTGYVKKEFLSDQSQAAPDVNPPVEKPDHNPALDSTLEVLETPVPAKITADGGLHLRVECDANAKSLVLMPQGDYVLVLEQGDTWCYVGYEGENGYCMTSYLKMDPA